jgi:AcrR family transcriptional regulator
MRHAIFVDGMGKRVAVKPDGRVTRAERQRGERRAQVLDAARRLFAESGYHATSINDIIVASDIARGTFYLYFASKRAIFEELLDGFFATLTTAFRRIDTSPDAAPPIEQMNANVDRIFDLLDAERPMARILLRGAVGIDVDFDRKLADFYGRVTDLIERALRSGIEMRLVRPCDPRLLSRCILGSSKEIIDHVFNADPRRRREDELHAIGRVLVDFNLRGLFA